MRNPLQRRHRSSSTSSSSPPLPLLPHELHNLIHKIIFPAGRDFEGHQMICICACHFPSPRTIAYDTLLPLLLDSIDSYVTTEYTLIFFAGQAEHKPNMTWMLSAYQNLERKYRKGIRKLFIVHSGTWTRIVLEVAGRVVSPKFAKKVKYVGSLSELAEHVPLTQINIPPAVYSCNLLHESEIILPHSYDTFRTQLFGVDLARIMGADGSRGLPRVIIDAISYLRAEALSVEGLFRVSPSQSSLQCAIAAYDRGHPVDLRDYGPHVAASLIKQFLSMLLMPVFPAHIYPALQKFPTIPDDDRTRFVQKNVIDRLDPPVVILLSAVTELLDGIYPALYTLAFLFSRAMLTIDVSSAAVLTKMPPLNLAIVITLTLLHHPHDPRLDAQLSNPAQNGGAALVLIHLITNHPDIFPSKPLPPPPMPPRPSSTPPETTSSQSLNPRPPELSPKRFLSEDSRPLHKKASTVRLVSADSTDSLDETRPKADLFGTATTSLSTPLPSAEFGGAPNVARGKGRVPNVGSGVVEELRRVYEERCKIVRTQEPGRKEGTAQRPGNRGGMGLGIGRVG